MHTPSSTPHNLQVQRLIRRYALPALTLLIAFLLAACDNQQNITATSIATFTALPIVAFSTTTALPTETSIPSTPTPLSKPPPPPSPSPSPTQMSSPTASPFSNYERGFVPVLSYHHIREWQDSDTEDDRAYITPPSTLEEQLQFLEQNGYVGVTADQVYEYYANGQPLPEKPIMLSFDDNIDNQFTSARPLLQQYGFPATFFVMTVTIDKDFFMTADQLKTLNADGFDIELHTWDHHLVTEYETEDDWRQQLAEPRETIKELLGQEARYFAYPGGVYNKEVVEKLKQYGYRGAFRLREISDDEIEPEFAIKRYIANSYWTIEQFQQVIRGEWE